MPPPHKHRPTPELKALQALLERCNSSPPTQTELETQLENGLARVMLLEGQLRARTSPASGPAPSDLTQEIHALRETIAQLRAHTHPGKPTPLAHGFTTPHKP